MADHNDFGKKGEQIAVDYLRGKGFRILETNWRRGRNEIDIIARDGKVLVVVEVKSRHSTLDFTSTTTSPGIQPWLANRRPP